MRGVSLPHHQWSNRIFEPRNPTTIKKQARLAHLDSSSLVANNALSKIESPKRTICLDKVVYPDMRGYCFGESSVIGNDPGAAMIAAICCMEHLATMTTGPNRYFAWTRDLAFKRTAGDLLLQSYMLGQASQDEPVQRGPSDHRARCQESP